MLIILILYPSYLRVLKYHIFIYTPFLQEYNKILELANVIFLLFLFVPHLYFLLYIFFPHHYLPM